MGWTGSNWGVGLHSGNSNRWNLGSLRLTLDGNN